MALHAAVRVPSGFVAVNRSIKCRKFGPSQLSCKLPMAGHRLGVTAGNSRHLQTLLLVCAKLLRYLGERSPPAPAGVGCRGVKAATAGATVNAVNNFLFAAGLDDINMFRLIRCSYIPYF